MSRWLERRANLGGLMAAGPPVPPSFVVTATAYLDAVSESGAARLARQLGGLNVDDPISLIEARWAAHEEIMAPPSQAKSPMPSTTHIAASGLMLPSRCGRRERPRMQVTAHSPD
jgi:phosphoenolpyruvate synthase/pyruvate phosphate dikinase